MLSLLGFDGLLDYVQIVMSNIFGSSPFIFVFLSILACSPLLLIALAK